MKLLSLMMAPILFLHFINVSTSLPKLPIERKRCWPQGEMHLLVAVPPAESCTWINFDTIASTNCGHIVDSPKLQVTSPLYLMKSALIVKYSIQCSIVTYFDSIITTNFSHIDEHWQRYIPGVISSSFHFAAARQNPSVGFWNLPFVRRLSNFVLILSTNGLVDSSDLIILMPNRHQATQRYINAGKYLKGELLISHEIMEKKGGIFWNKWKDVQGEQLPVAVPPTQSQKTLKAFVDNRIYTYAIVEVAEAARFLNGTIVAVPTDISRGFGSKLPNGSWDSYIGKVLSDEVAFSAPFFPHQSQYDFVLFAKPVMYSQTKFLTPLPKKATIGISFLTNPFDKWIWGMVFFGMLFNALAIYFFTVASPVHSKKLNVSHWSLRTHLSNICRNIINTMRVCVEQPIPDAYANFRWASPAIRFVYLAWLLVVIVIVPLYKSVMISDLVEPGRVHPPRNYKQLIKSDFKVNVLMYKAIVHQAMPWADQLKHPVTDYNVDIRGCLKTLLQGDNVCLFVLHWLYLLAPLYLVDASGSRKFLVSKDSLTSFGSHFCISQNNPQLQEALNDVTTAIIEGGLNQLWIELEFHQRSIQAINRRMKCKEEDGQLDDILIDDKILRIPIMLSAVGLISAVFVCLLETLHDRIQHKGKFMGQRVFEK